MTAAALTPEDLRIRSVGACTRHSPMRLPVGSLEETGFIRDSTGVQIASEFDGEVSRIREVDAALRFEKAGPRALIHFDPAKTRVGIVTCGGLCPGINNVIRAAVLALHHQYGVRDVLGYRYGYQGLAAGQSMPLTLENVSGIHRQGGTILGTSRGAPPIGTLVDTLVRDGVQILIAIGGDGTQRGAHAIVQEIERRGLGIAVVGIPKTIDNDIAWVQRSFGFDTAVGIARTVLDDAHTEATSVANGIGLVKLMGRDAGFIAAHATLASADVNFCLVPEVPFELDGPHGLLQALQDRLALRGHALIAIAEGCSAGLLGAAADAPRDASGNLAYVDPKLDVGARLRELIAEHFAQQRIAVTMKYIDPSYMIRSVPANAADAVYCDGLARQAVHAAMTGRTDLLIGRWHRSFTHVPIPLATAMRHDLHRAGALWRAVVETTGQPALRAHGPGTPDQAGADSTTPR